MLKNKTHRLVTAGLMVAIGIILPLFLSHIFGIPGTMLLPMHIPILLCGLLCGPQFGALNGIVIPVLSSVLTGMPPVYPMLPIMMVQLTVMGLVSGLLYEKFRRNIYVSMLAAMLSGWMLYGLTFSALLFMNSQLKALPVMAAIAKGWLGILLQLAVIPVIVTVVERYLYKQNIPESKSSELKEQAIELIRSKTASCVIIKDNTIIHTADGRGVSPLLKVYKSDSAMLTNAIVVDKIIGKAAAMILVLGGVKQVYGVIMSTAGRDYLERHGIITEYGRCVDIITNRTHDGICPIEKSVLEIEDPQEGLAVLNATIENLMKKAAAQ